MGRKRAVGALVVVVMLAACGSAKHVSGAAATSSPETPTLAVALTDHGLTYSPSRLAAARYRISFTDRRAHPPAGQKVALAIGPSGPRFALVTVPLGGSRVGVLLQNDIPWLVIDGVKQNPAYDNALTITTSAQYPTPAT